MTQLLTHSRTWIAAGLTLSLAAACSDEDGDGARASVGQTQVSAATAQLALDELTASVDTTVTGFGGQKPVTPAPAGAPAAPSARDAINLRCAAGGDAAIGGHVNVVPLPVAVDVKVAIDYNNCVTQTGTTLEGDIEFSQTVAAGPGTPLRVETLYSGDVTFMGKLNFTCPIDLNVLVDETGRAVEVAGQFCGQDARALNLQIMPRWSAR